LDQERLTSESQLPSRRRVASSALYHRSVSSLG